MINNQKTSLERFADALYYKGFLTGNGNHINELLEHYKEIYNDEIEAVIINECAEESTSAAHNQELHRQQIIEAYIAAKMERNLVKKHFAYFLKLERVTQKAQEYYNETYNNTK